MTMPEMTAVSPSGATTDSPGLTKRAGSQQGRITLARNGGPEVGLASADDLEGLEMTLEILRDSAAAERISRSLAALGRGERGVNIATVRGELARAISKRLPAAAAAEVIEFCDSALALSPCQVGRPLFGPLAGCHGVRRGTYRIVYRIDEETMMVEVLDIDQRADIHQWSLRRAAPGRPPPRAGTGNCERAWVGFSGRRPGGQPRRRRRPPAWFSPRSAPGSTR